MTARLLASSAPPLEHTVLKHATLQCLAGESFYAKGGTIRTLPLAGTGAVIWEAATGEQHTSSESRASAELGGAPVRKLRCGDSGGPGGQALRPGDALRPALPPTIRGCASDRTLSP